MAYIRRLHEIFFEGNSLQLFVEVLHSGKGGKRFGKGHLGKYIRSSEEGLKLLACCRMMSNLVNKWGLKKFFEICVLWKYFRILLLQVDI